MIKIQEIWKPIVGFEKNYEISNLGNIKNTHNGKLRKCNPDKQGYIKVSIRVTGIVKFYKIHRLVAEAFIPNPENKPLVNHKDRNPSNNMLNNLEWVTPLENVRHFRGQSYDKPKFTVSDIDDMYKYFKSGKTLSEITGIYKLRDKGVIHKLLLYIHPNY